jgi:hypothetical protein
LSNLPSYRLEHAKKAIDLTTGKTDETATLRVPGNDRLPRPGTILTRRYKGRTLQVEVLEHRIAFEGKTYRSLGAVAKLPAHAGRADGNYREQEQDRAQ